MSRPENRAASLLGAAVLATALLAAACAMPDIKVTTPPFSTLPDGAYEGSHDGGMVKASVSVAMAGGSIASVRILSHDCGTGKPAERIIEDVVARQSLDVDAVAGATYSSRVILKAIENALTR